jgi:hypothetical protein
MLAADLTLTGNTIILTNDNLDAASTLRFVNTGGGNMISSDTVAGGILNVSDNKLIYNGARDANTEGDFIGLGLGCNPSAITAVKENTDIICEHNTYDFGDATFVTEYQFTDFNSANVKANNLLSPESDIRRRLISDFSGAVITDKTMPDSFRAESGIQQSFALDVVTTLFESSAFDNKKEIISGALTGSKMEIQCFSDDVLVYSSGEVDPRGETSDGAVVSVFPIPRITGAKSVKVTARSYSGTNVCGWQLIRRL